VSSPALSWSESYPLPSSTSRHHLGIQEAAGVYRIRAFDQEGQPAPIARAGGTDPLGILHIGESEQLGIRVRHFRQAAEGLAAQHPAGRRFHRWGFARQFPIARLRFDYARVQGKSEARRLEGRLHEEYSQKYLDLPPLDAQQSKRA